MKGFHYTSGWKVLQKCINISNFVKIWL